MASFRLAAIFVGTFALHLAGGVQFRKLSDRGADTDRNPFSSFFSAFGAGGGGEAPADTSTSNTSVSNVSHIALAANATAAVQKINSTALSADEAAIKQIKEAVKATNSVDGEDAEVAEIKRAAGLAAGGSDDDVPSFAVPVPESATAESHEVESTKEATKGRQSGGKHKPGNAGKAAPGTLALKARTGASFNISNLSWYNKPASDFGNMSQLMASEAAAAPNVSIPHPGRRHRRHRRKAPTPAPEAAPVEEAPQAPQAPEAPEAPESPAPAPQPSPAPAGLAPLPRRQHAHDDGIQGAELHDDSHYDFACDESTKDCTRSMCRWLKMSSRDSQGRCSLFEWQLRSCDYNLPESRPEGTLKQPLDCAIEILRLPDVPAQEVAQNVRELDVCVDGVPPEINATCFVPLGLLRNEIHDWKQEATLMTRVNALRKDLANASALGKAALEHGNDLGATIDELKEVLDASDKLPGHFLVNEVREARGYLDRLTPIPAVRQELADGAARAREAFQTASLYTVKQAMVWLEVTIKKAKRLQLNTEADLAQHTVSGLAGLKAALLDLRDAKFRANVSVSTKSDVIESLHVLNASIHRASDAGLKDGMHTARDLLHELSALKKVVHDAADAEAEGGAILAIGGNKGQTSLEHAVKRLNVTLAHADVMGLADNSTISKARGTFDGVLYILQARRALQKAQEHGLRILDVNSGELSDDEEEAATALIRPALEWGKEVGLVNGLDAVESTEEKLEVREHTKENMTLALATGNASLEAKAGMSEAISMLESAMETSHRCNTSAGVEMAEQQVEQLRALLSAREALVAAKAKAVDSLQSRSDFEEAQSALNASVHQAREVGLDKDADIAAKDLQRLTEFAAANSRLERALAKEFPSRKAPDQVNVTDPERNVTFRKTGLKVVDLPEAPGGQDDGDEDFEEHIVALRAGLEASKRQDEIDPKMQAAYKMALANRDAYESLLRSMALGEASMQSKTGIEPSIQVLSAARREAIERGLAIGTKKAAALLEDLQRIPPALDAIRGAILKVNVSIHTTSTMEASLLAVNKAIELNKDLNLDRYVPMAEELRDRLSRVKQAYVGLKAASLQGKISLQNEDGEEAAMSELSRAIAIAKDVNVAKGMEDALELYDELRHMNLQHDQLQNSMSPMQS